MGGGGTVVGRWWGSSNQCMERMADVYGCTVQELPNRNFMDMLYLLMVFNNTHSLW